MTVSDVLSWLNGIAPFDTAEPFDNVGLLLGDPNHSVHKILFVMDLTEDVADEAIRSGAGMIISHHPFIFHPLKRIDYYGPQGRSLVKLVDHRISVIAAHTNWDKASGGISDSLAAQFGLLDISAADDYVRIGSLPSPLSIAAFEQLVCNSLHFRPRIYGNFSQTISRVAVAGGSYGEGYRCAVAAGAQAYLTGEIAHHEILDACERGLTILDSGHFATEFPGVKALYQRFLTDAKIAQWPVEALLYTKAPFAGASLA